MKKEPQTLQEALEKLDEAIEDLKFELSQTAVWRFVERMAYKLEMFLEDLWSKK